MSDFHDICLNYALSPARTILEILFIPVIFCAYYPQYTKNYKHGTSGISSQFILCLSLFSTMQFVSHLFRIQESDGNHAVVNCIHSGSLSSMQVFSALVGHLQVLGQWLSALIWLIIFLISRTQENDSERAPLLDNVDPVPCAPGNEPDDKIWWQNVFTHDLPSDVILYILFAQAVVFFSVTVGLLLALTPSPSVSFGPLFQLAVTLIFQEFCNIVGFLLAIVLCAVQIRDAKARPTAEGVSVWSLGLQGVVMLALGIFLVLHPHEPYGELSLWALCLRLLFWGVPLNYFVVAAGCGVSVWSRVLHSW